MTSSYKGQTENTLQSSSAGNTEAKVQPSAQSAGTDNTKTSTPITRRSSKPTKNADNSEKVQVLSDILRTTVKQLEKRGLIKRFKVLSKDRTTVKEIRIVLSPDVWTTDLELK